MKIKNRVIQLLEQIGLTRSEAIFYLTVNQYPKLTIREIQEKSGISKTSSYRIFENLKVLGLLTSSKDNWRKNVEVVSINSLANKLAKEQRKLRKTELELKKLENLMNIGFISEYQDPIDILVDQNKIEEQCDKILYKPWDHMACYGSAERLLDIMEESERNFLKMRTKKGKSVDAVITEIGDYAKEFMPNNDKHLRNMKLCIDENHQSYMAYIYDNEVTIWHKDEELGNRAIVIRDPVMVKMHENIFKSFWSSK